MLRVKSLVQSVADGFGRVGGFLPGRTAQLFDHLPGGISSWGGKLSTATFLPQIDNLFGYLGQLVVGERRGIVEQGQLFGRVSEPEILVGIADDIDRELH